MTTEQNPNLATDAMAALVDFAFGDGLTIAAQTVDDITVQSDAAGYPAVFTFNLDNLPRLIAEWSRHDAHDPDLTAFATAWLTVPDFSMLIDCAEGLHYYVKAFAHYTIAKHGTAA